jgi:N-acetylmuramoyl-L-alanine amidase CwlA
VTISAPHPPFISARWHGGKQKPRLIVLHSTVGPTRAGSAKAVAEYFANRPEDDRVSAHYVVDESNRFQCVGDHTVAYHCGYNQDSIGVEMCDYPSHTSKARWSNPEHRHLFTNTAHLVARLCLVYNIRPYYVPAWKLKLGIKGVTTHAEMTKAFNRSTHWDPGAWPRYRFMREVRAHYKRLKARG